jgi:glutamate racemase
LFPSGTSSLPIGVFDSGIGGLSVVRSLRAALPSEDVIYFADSAHCPYGSRSEDFILERSLAIAHALTGWRVKALIVACNTACAVALEALRSTFSFPIIGLEPAVKPAVNLTRTGRIGVVATPRTIASQRLGRLVERYAVHIDVERVAAPGWVELVEHGDLDSRAARQAIQSTVKPVVKRGADVLVLGCTHYPFLAPLVQAIAGERVCLVESGPAVAARTETVLEASGSLRRGVCARGTVTMLTSGSDAAAVGTLAARLLGEPVGAVTVGV